MSTDDATLKLHTAQDGVLWYLDGDRPARPVQGDREEFLRGPAAKHAEKVRVLGARVNVPLIVELGLLHRSGVLNGLELATPLAASSQALKSDPEAVLLAMRKWKDAPSRGGWHEMTSSEAISFCMANSLLAGAASEALRGLLFHPAWPYLKLIPHLHSLSICHLIAEILDPRYYVDVDEPDRLSKLESYLGLGDLASQRYRLTLSCWYGDKPGDKELNSMAYFLWRVYCKYGSAEKGAVRASQKFIAYLRHTWLEGLYAGRLGEPLFDPDSFFTPAESMWFKSVWNKSVDDDSLSR